MVCVVTAKWFVVVSSATQAVAIFILPLHNGIRCVKSTAGWIILKRNGCTPAQMKIPCFHCAKPSHDDFLVDLGDFHEKHHLPALRYRRLHIYRL